MRGACAALGFVLLLPSVAAAQPPVEAAAEPVFLGEATLPHGLELDGVPLGGLSALVLDSERGLLYALSDDPGWRGPPRFYTLSLAFEAGRLAGDGVKVEATTRLTDRRGRPFAQGFFDGEGLALTSRRTLLASSEGNVDEGLPPSLWEFDLDGRARRRLRLPRRFLPRPGRRGVRHNLALEGLTVTPGGETAYLGTENALVQDGDPSSLTDETLCRLARFDPKSRRFLGDYLYPAEPIAAPPVPADDFAVNGLVELLAIGPDRLLALERSYSAGVGNRVRLFETRLGSEPMTHRPPRRWWQWWRPKPRPPRLTKRLVLDLAELADAGIAIDNLEGLAVGPPLADGRCTLLMVSDDNFSDQQRTQFLAFALPPELSPPGCSNSQDFQD